jgi:hypothetical protein
VFLSAALPLYALTPLKILDPQRIAVLAAVPIAIISGHFLKENKRGFLLVFTAFLIVSSTFLTLDLAKGTKVDANLVEVLQKAPEGRFIAPESPSWFPLLPVLTGKPSIDGLSPFERILPEIRALPCQHFGLWFDGISVDERNKIYSHFITNSEDYAIKYVIITKNTSFIMPDVEYESIYSSDGFEVLSLRNNISFVTGGDYERPGAQTFIITPHSDVISVKEAYTSSWKSDCGNVTADNLGFIKIEGKCDSIILRYEPSIFDAVK